MKKKFRAALLSLTHRLWNREISRILYRAYYSDHVISSEQFYVLAGHFDPTQVHCRVGRE